MVAVISSLIDKPGATVLVLAPHTDDGEFGCGGTTIAKMVERGTRVIYAAFSAAEKSVSPEFPARRAAARGQGRHRHPGVPTEDCLVYHFEVRKFREQRQDILDTMIKLNNSYRPDIVLLPSPNDTHQDHHTIAHEGVPGVQRPTMLGYEVPWNNLDFRTSCSRQALLGRESAAQTEGIGRIQVAGGTYLQQRTSTFARWRSPGHADPGAAGRDLRGAALVID